MSVKKDRLQPFENWTRVSIQIGCISKKQKVEVDFLKMFPCIPTAIFICSFIVEVDKNNIVQFYSCNLCFLMLLLLVTNYEILYEYQLFYILLICECVCEYIWKNNYYLVYMFLNFDHDWRLKIQKR